MMRDLSECYPVSRKILPVYKMNKRYLTIAVLLAANAAYADQNHYNDILIGDRASGMGGAYTAISDDPSGMYYNPAGIVYSPDTNTSSSALAYQLKTKRYANAIAGKDWIRNSSSFVPNFFGVLQPIGDGYFGLSYAMTDTVDEHQSQRFTNIVGSGGVNIDEFTIDLDDQDTTYKVGPSYAARLSDSLSYGVTLYFHLRDRIVSFNQVANLVPDPAAGDYDWTNQQIASSEVGINPVFGLMWAPTERSAIGATLRKTFIISSQTQLECTKQSATSTPAGTLCGTAFGSNDYVHVITTDNTYVDPPWEIALGWAGFPNNKEVYSADLKIYTGGDNVPTWNASAGYEHFFSARWNARFGLYTNNANTAIPAITDTTPVEHVDELGMSASIGRFTRTSSVSVGIAYVSGTGTRSNLAESGIAPVPTYINSTTIYLTAYYTN
jgi:hypothetical protein